MILQRIRGAGSLLLAEPLRAVLKTESRTLPKVTAKDSADLHNCLYKGIVEDLAYLYMAGIALDLQ